MFSVIFPGQGSQIVGMGKELISKYPSVKSNFDKADQILGFSISNMILNGPKEELDLTKNTQPAIFLLSYSIFNLIKNEFGIDLNKAKYFAGHSLGEYSALSAAGVISFTDTLKILKKRGEAMQSAVPKGEGGMLAILGAEVEIVEDIIKKFEIEIANDNSNGQLVVSGLIKNLDNLAEELKIKNIKNIKLPVSAPFHCKLMKKATEVMRKEIEQINFNNPQNKLISNVTAKEVSEQSEIKNLLIQQIESRVRWRESIINMINNGVKQFIEIGPGKVLSGLIKRIDKSVKVNAINNEQDINNIDIND